MLTTESLKIAVHALDEQKKSPTLKDDTRHISIGLPQNDVPSQKDK